MIDITDTLMSWSKKVNINYAKYKKSFSNSLIDDLQ